MTDEDRAKVIGRIFWTVLIVVILAVTYWFISKTNAKLLTVEPEKPPAAEQNPLIISHHHLPGDPESERMADILNRIQKKYGPLVSVKRIDVTQQPELSRKESVTKAPHVIMSNNTGRLYDFQGPMPEAKVEKKVDELLTNVRRSGKDWRPPVPGMSGKGI